LPDASQSSRDGKGRAVVEYEVDRMLACAGGDPVDVGSGHLDRGIDVASDLIATLRRAVPYDPFERDSSWVVRNERFGEYGELCSASCRFRNQGAE